jgi:hypothetical protein
MENKEAKSPCATKERALAYNHQQPYRFPSIRKPRTTELTTAIPFEIGDIVSGLEPGELVEIQRLAPFGGKTLVEGIGVETRRQVKGPLASEELLDR